MDWQTLLTIALAGACAVLLLYTWLRPFFARLAGACGGGCGGSVSQEGSGESGLVQIDGAPPPGRGDGSPG